MPKHLYLIINPDSGTGDPKAVLSEVSAELDQRTIEYVLKKVETPHEAFTAAQAIDLKKFDAVGVYGGDGTIIAVFKALYKQKTPVLIMPGGSANVLAKALNLPASAGDCLDLFLGNLYVLRHFGVAMANDAPLILDLHFGIWADSIEATNQRTKQRFGQLAYAFSAIKHLGSASRFNFQMTLDGKQVDVSAYACMVANEGYHTIIGVPFFPNSHTPGFLQVAAVKRVNQWAFLRWLTLRRLSIPTSSVVATWRVKEVVIQRAPKQMMFDDDIVTATLPLTIKSSPYMVAVIASTPDKSTFWRRLQMYAKVEPFRRYDHLRRFFRGGPSLKSSQIAPNLYVGGQYRPWAIARLRRWGVTGVVNMRNVRRPSNSRGLEVLNLPTPDHQPPSLASLYKGVEFIQHHLDAGGAVYLHCRLGEGRGPSMAAAYLISQGMRANDAVAHIERFRRLIRPNAKQLRQLARFEAELNQKKV
ncbi:MAG TPA: diacylglycerol kinase family protein [Candidatus Saccharimonadia bacterium]